MKRVERGKVKMRESWEEVKGMIEAKNSVVGYLKEPMGIIMVEEESVPPAEAVKGVKGGLIFYQDVNHEPGDTLFTLSLVTTKVIMGNKMKAPYGPALPFFVNT